MVQKSYRVIVKHNEDKQDVYSLGVCDSLWDALNKCEEKYPKIDLDANNIDINITINDS